MSRRNQVVKSSGSQSTTLFYFAAKPLSFTFEYWHVRFSESSPNMRL